MSVGAYSKASSSKDGGGAYGLRPRRRWSIAAAVVAVAAIAVTVGLLVAGASNHRDTAASRYGGYPSWLPHTTLPPVNTVLRASVSHPQLSVVEGNTIEVQLPSGARADVTAVGPAFPAWVSAAVQAGTLTDGNPVPATFTLTVIALRGEVPLRASAFSILTAGGQLLHPAIAGPSGARVPATLRAGQHMNLTVKAQLVEGDGSLRWAPTGTRVVTGWLYQLELD